MSESDKPLGSSGLRGPTQDFADFCEQERLRRIRSGEAFNQQRYQQVVSLVMEKLEAMEAEE